ncbi:MAG TPA: O-antigen ligase family protein [bacterium]|nr:O-antigen ligase family protein [bacterium]
MKQPFPILVQAGLIAGAGAAALLHGGHSRLHWPPISIMLLGLLAAFIVRSIHQDRPPRFNAPMDLFLFAYLAWITLSAVFSFNREQSLGEALRMTIPVAAYFLAAYAAPPQKKYLVLGLGAVILMEAAGGLLEVFSPGFLPAALQTAVPATPGRVHGTFVNYNHFAGLMEAGIFLSFGVLNTVDLDPDVAGFDLIAKRALFAIPGGLMIIALVLSMSRGGWASSLAGIIFFAAIFRWRLLKDWKRIALLAGVILILAGAFLVKANRDLLAKRIGDIEALYQENEISGNERISLWKSSLEMVRDHPLFGVGWGAFKDAYPSYRRDNIFVGLVFAHNDFLQIAATSGVPGLAFFLLFVAMTFGQGFKVIRADAEDFETRVMPGILAGLFAMLVHESVDFGLMLTSNAMVFFMLCGIIAGRAREPS